MNFNINYVYLDKGYICNNCRTIFSEKEDIEMCCLLSNIINFAKNNPENL